MEDAGLNPGSGAEGAIEYFAGSIRKHSALMLAAATVSGVTGFVYKVAMSRLLPMDGFAAFYTLLNFFTIFSVPALALEMSVARLVSRLRASGSYPEIAAVVKTAGRKVSLIALSGAAVFLPAVFPATRLLGLQGSGPVLITLLALVLFMPLNVGYGAIQGLQSFRWWGGTMVAVSLARLGSGAFLVWTGSGVSGALGASVFGIGLGIVLTGIPLKVVKGRPGAAPSGARAGFGAAAGIFPALLLMTYLAFGDMPLVKHFFPPDVSAVYGASSILGRAVFYIALPVSMAMFPKVCFAGSAGAPSAPLLKKSISVFLMLSASLSAVYFLFPGFAARLLFTDAYAGAGGLIKYFGFVFMPSGLCLLLVQYNLALGRRRFLPSLTAAAAAHFALISFFNATPGQVLGSIACAGFLGVVLMLAHSGFFCRKAGL